MITIGLQPIAPCIVTHIQFILLVHMFLYGLNISLLNITLSHFILEPNHNQPPIKRKILLVSGMSFQPLDDLYLVDLSISAHQSSQL